MKNDLAVFTVAIMLFKLVLLSVVPLWLASILLVSAGFNFLFVVGLYQKQDEVRLSYVILVLFPVTIVAGMLLLGGLSWQKK